MGVIRPGSPGEGASPSVVCKTSPVRDGCAEYQTLNDYKYQLHQNWVKTILSGFTGTATGSLVSVALGSVDIGFRPLSH